MTTETLESPALYVVATPIGNLEDITLRAKRVLENCDLIAAEDTRVTAKLLQLLGLPKKKLVSFYDQIEQKKAGELIAKIKEEGISLALVSDAGTPLISDPGYHLTKLAHEEEVKVIPIPGPSSLTSLVSASGLPNSRVLFLGFLPKKKNQMKTEMESWSSFNSSVVFFESTKRIVKTMEAMVEIYPQAQVCVGRELTKKNETIRQDSCSSLLVWLKEKAVLKGELAVMVSLPKQEEKVSVEEVTEQIKKFLKSDPSVPTKDLVKRLQDTGFNQKELYQLIIKLKTSLLH